MKTTWNASLSLVYPLLEVVVPEQHARDSATAAMATASANKGK
jgi:hypothetical protein